MKIVAMLFFMFCSVSSDAQIHDSLKGCWIPENAVLAKQNGDSAKMDSSLRVVESFIISREATVGILEANHSYADSTNKIRIDTHNIIIILPYRWEGIIFHVKKVTVGGKEKYKVNNLFGIFSAYKKMYEKYDNADAFISKSSNKLLLEVVEKNGTLQKIFFINGVGNNKFKNYADAMKYLYGK